MIRLFRDEKGAAAIELALVLPLYLLILWFGAEASYHYRLDNSLHRATASLAEMLANPPLEKSESLPDRLPYLTAPALSMLSSMMRAEETAAQVGLRVSYYRAFVPGSGTPADPPVQFEAGRQCPSTGLQPLNALAYEGGGPLTTAANNAKTELVRVEACYFGGERWTMGDFVFPRDFSSNFTTLRKEW